MKLWISAGELSGDIQAAELLHALRLECDGRNLPLEAVGMGGDRLEQAGQRNILSIEELSVMGVVEVLGILPRIPGILRRIRRAMEQEKPDAVIQFPGGEDRRESAYSRVLLHPPESMGLENGAHCLS